jgi:hypothetical protein
MIVVAAQLYCYTVEGLVESGPNIVGAAYERAEAVVVVVVAAETAVVAFAVAAVTSSVAKCPHRYWVVLVSQLEPVKDVASRGRHDSLQHDLPVMLAEKHYQCRSEDEPSP